MLDSEGKLRFLLVGNAVAAGASAALWASSKQLIGRLREHRGVATVKASATPAGYRIELAHEEAHRSVLALLIETGITSIRTSRPSLEEMYVQLIGERGLKL